ncbi:MAG: UxaA family hydrolase, partial [Rhodospirillaceae bacterium]|nr:UxaA family hydrolase [Rhodospirillaceae bacterium]
MTNTLLLDPADDVVVLTAPAAAGDCPLGIGVALAAAVQQSHKLARHALAEGAAIRKFGQIIGYATQAIAEGEHVHSHNCAIGAHDRAYAIAADLEAARRAIPQMPPRSFRGFRRADGRVGTRNMIALCATVNCSATVVRMAADQINRSGILADFPNVDGVAAFAHGTG